MKLSIITINYNNVDGLKHTLDSIAAQTYHDIEHIIIDGGSTDGSVDAIKEYVSTNPHKDSFFKHTINWVSEKDNGIYNAMNKGIRKATGAYVQILNSGDILAAPDVIERIITEVEKAEYPELLYGNMIKKDYTTGKLIGKSGEIAYGLLNYYVGTLNHDCCYFRRDLFNTYGIYDESLKIVSDWKWFVQAIGLGHVKPEYVNIDVTIFDASGISESNLELRNKERRQVLKELLPPAVLADYDAHAFDVVQMNRLRKRHFYWLVYFIERVLFKLEKWHIIRSLINSLSH